MASASEARLCSGTLTNSNATLYTAPTGVGNYVIIISVWICNKTASDATITLKVDSVDVVSGFVVLANDSISLPMAGLVLEATELIEGSSDVSDAINYYISGKIVTA